MISQIIKSKSFVYLIFIIALLFYLFSIDAPFTYDDFSQIVFNENIQSLNIKKIILNGLRETRVIQNLSFGLNYKISQLEVWSYHLVNILLHLINGYLFYLIIAKMVPDKRTLIIFSLLIFLFHPLQVQSVVYIMGRISLLQAFIYFLAIILYQKNYSKWIIGPVLLIGLITKESCVLIPIVFMIYDKFVNKTSIKRGVQYFIFLLLCFCILYFAFNKIGLDHSHSEVVGYTLYPMSDYIIYSFYQFIFYLYQFVFCNSLSMIHPFYIDTKILSFSLISFLIILYLFVIFKKLLPIYKFIILFGLITVSNFFIQLINPYAEYRFYILNGLVGFLFVSYLINIIPSQKRVIIVMVIFVLFAGYLNFRYQKNYLNSEDTYRNVVENYPDSWIGYHNLAFSLMLKNKLSSAEKAEKIAYEMISKEILTTYIVHISLVRILLINNKTDEAKKIMKIINPTKLKNTSSQLFFYNVCKRLDLQSENCKLSTD